MANNVEFQCTITVVPLEVRTENSCHQTGPAGGCEELQRSLYQGLPLSTWQLKCIRCFGHGCSHEYLAISCWGYQGNLIASAALLNSSALFVNKAWKFSLMRKLAPSIAAGLAAKYKQGIAVESCATSYTSVWKYVFCVCMCNCCSRLHGKGGFAPPFS